MQKGSVRPEEIARFDALAARWWDPSGPMQPLHMMNPCRAGWILERIRRKFGGSDVAVLDVGCGAGLLSESLAEAGCNVLGLDAGEEAIAAAKAHAAGSAAGRGLRLAYRAGTAEALAAEGRKYAVITALEIIEHVAEPAAFVATLAALLEPGGLLFLSTLNRTARSYAVAKFGAEYLLRLLPVGTHDWQHFVTPEELGRFCRGAGLRLADSAGMSFSPLRRGFAITRDMSVNYIAMAEA
ncbi:MAG TPA: bifunctional 2-polyprenyl-6-hydroxyphenol methylase/3-demethylubiquinol 3-O-methyltransferase UbiG [Acidocella sp.]|jgi:2-polyprenyl-6-hydroxyphenyl methylase/3-demethylubiquinone-9 3-methyltransferase|uniref:bifunctional 2-polyprenyl-6-hydroxyphenol methylase/3-demethylubiquinol 3-O-methyltransferase UbiG n=1 Tax=Acidocella sp. TaxID=50710 RepID=UPI002D11BA21|nr:bifunctional 2-polyprenyl-6-hydroxyphenol methylase/3-demethylubiquinol 3-O-methyltransferase UbiG [Acidocella sp.]HVE20729.1 bifunctional 2-polyprenyl-6-hydroxyphenol methylase/3-demethylubiquinol 3-O-methyltransferase UbiG [Acidocella sp.]